MSSYAELLALDDPSGFSNDRALEELATLIDEAGDRNDATGVDKALAWCELLDTRDFSEEQRATFDYFWANAWANRQHDRNQDRAAAWEWDHPELGAQLFRLRRAYQSLGFPKLDAIRRCQILTNIGNQLNTSGRFVEAQEYWSEALALMPQFWMAQGNRGQGLIRYAQALYDAGQHQVFLVFGHDDLTQAIKAAGQFNPENQPYAKAWFSDQLQSLRSYIPIEEIRKGIELDGFSLGRSKAERTYRNWCLNRRLFLNPLNDLGVYPIAASDVFTLPSFTLPLGEHPVLAGFFNQMKQEFASARWLYYEGVMAHRPHFSDKDVLLYNTLDYPSYSLGVEKMKLAYRSAYSLFDKIAFFLNSYLDLGIKPTAVSFARVWREKDAGPVREVFERAENWPWRGLYWLSKDLFLPDFREVIEPDMRALKVTRDHMEHKYLKVHEMLSFRPADDPASKLFTDTLAFSVSRAELERKTLRVLKLARAALIYLSLGMHREEERRDAEGPPDTRRISGGFDTWDDRWKF